MVKQIFDTRDKKPKVYNIAILSGITAAVMAVLLLLGDRVPLAVISGVIVIYVALVIFMLMQAFYRQLQYNPYSYNTIYYFGFSLFLLSILISHIILTVRILGRPGDFDIYSIAGLLLDSAAAYVRLSAPLILVFSVLLVVSNISLLLHEVRRFVNVLGILLAFLMVAGEVFLFFADRYASGSIRDILVHDLLVNLFACFYLYFECMVIGAAVGDLIAATYRPAPDKDFIIILGCSIRKDGTPTPLLAGRINKALAFYRWQLKTTGKAAVFVPSGGQGPDESISESLCMRNYLVEHGVPDEHILMEDQSTSTYENMKFSKELIQSVTSKTKDASDVKVAFSTTNYHVFRSGMMGRRVKMRAQGMGAKTKWYFWPNAAVREFAGLLSSHRGKQLIILVAMIAIYVGLAFLQYGTQL